LQRIVVAVLAETGHGRATTGHVIVATEPVTEGASLRGAPWEDSSVFDPPPHMNSCLRVVTLVGSVRDDFCGRGKERV
jgi:hypothetical protein